MAERLTEIRHIFVGGWATDFGPTAEVAVNGGLVQVPFLLEAQNVFFELNGGIRKIGGLTKLNSTTIGSGEEIRGICDYSRQGSLGSPTQKRVCHAGTSIYKDDADGSFSAIKTGLEDNAVPCYCIFNDELIISSDSTTDVPFKWDQTTFANLGGSPPNFSFCVVHKNRVFAAGVASAPSVLYYSDANDHETWGSGDAGSIMIGNDDGDVITGLVSFAGELIVFKGPNHGSIHAISGSQNSDFAQRLISGDLGAVGHNTIFNLPKDIGFVWSDGTIHSLRTTDRQGNYEQGSLSLPIDAYLRGNVNHDRLNRSWAVGLPSKNQVVITLPIASSDVPNLALMMDYRFEPFRFARWDAITAWSVQVVRDPTNNDLQNFFFGGSDGFIRKSDQATRAIDGTTAISGLLQTPHMLYASYARLKNLHAVGIGVRPRGDYNLTFAWYRDNEAKQTDTVSQGGSDVLGDADANEFTLDTSTLSGNRFSQRWIELLEGGSFRSISYEISNAMVSQDLECHTITVLIDFNQISLEN